jgi:hypothetical protein
MPRRKPLELVLQGRRLVGMEHLNGVESPFRK